MDDAIRLQNVGGTDLCLAALGVADIPASVLLPDGKGFALDGRQNGLAAVGRRLRRNVGRGQASGYDVIRQDPGKLCLVFREKQRVDRTGGQLCKRRIGCLLYTSRCV